MQFVKLLAHLFVPHESNNQKAKTLHPSGLSILILFLLFFQLMLGAFPKTFPNVLGYASNISPAEVIRLTNIQRSSAGLSPLSENSILSSAALAKGNDMLAKDYWAHFAPDGTSPWSFFSSFGYKYRYAGENLARDFSNPASAVDAWMASPTHRENILNGNYKEIGIGVVEGSLAGVDTTIIVQFFGTPQNVTPEIAAVQAREVALNIPIETQKPKPTTVAVTVSTPIPDPTVTPTPTPIAQKEVTSSGFVSPFSSTKGVSLGVVSLLLVLLAIDMMVVKKRRIVRIGGRTLAHIAFLGMILAVIIILKAGKII
jgi:hypothetical protein